MEPWNALAEELEARLRDWRPETAAQAQERIADVIEWADAGLLGLIRFREVEQGVLDLLDEPQPGDVRLADLGLAAKTRPVVIVSRRDPASRRVLILYVPLMTQSRPSSYEVSRPRLSFLDRESFANVQGLGSIPSIRLERQIGRTTEQTMAEIRRALAYALDPAR